MEISFDDSNNKQEEEEPYSVRKKREQASGKKAFVKINSKKNKKKLTFNELTFVEPHVDTFYVGLNDEVPRGAYNPVHAKTVELDKAKDWVHPDTQLNRFKQREFKSRTRRTSTMNTKLKELTFVEGDNVANEDVEDINFAGGMHLESLFDQENATVFISNTSILTPKSHKIYVEDTPVENYGLSLRERRKKGLHI